MGYKRDYIVEFYGDHEDGAPLFADGFDEAIIGICPNTLRVAYSREKCIKIVMNDDDCTEEEALDYLEYNTFNAYVGEYTPIWIDDLTM